MPEEGAPKDHEYKGKVNDTVTRKFEDDMKFIRRLTPWKFEIDRGFVGHMNVPGTFYVNSALEELMFDELRSHCQSGGYGGFLPAVKQIANVAALPGMRSRNPSI